MFASGVSASSRSVDEQRLLQTMHKQSSGSERNSLDAFLLFERASSTSCQLCRHFCTRSGTVDSKKECVTRTGGTKQHVNFFVQLQKEGLLAPVLSHQRVYHIVDVVINVIVHRTAEKKRKQKRKKKTLKKRK